MGHSIEHSLANVMFGASSWKHNGVGERERAHSANMYFIEKYQESVDYQYWWVVISRGCVSIMEAELPEKLEKSRRTRIIFAGYILTRRQIAMPVTTIEAKWLQMVHSYCSNNHVTVEPHRGIYQDVSSLTAERWRNELSEEISLDNQPSYFL